MKQRQIGSLHVSVVGLGCNNFGKRLDEKESAAVVDAALEAGINLLDTANIYGDGRSEEFIGRALASRRERVVIATKFGSRMKGEGKGARPAYIRKAIETSLRRLGTDRIDLYQLHEPDSTVPIEETLGALAELVEAGTVREIGCSNFTVDQIRAADAAAREGAARFASVQNEYSLMHREPEAGVLAECERLGLAFLPYFPLASGLLTGKYRRGRPAPDGTRLAEKRFANELSDRNLATVEDLIRFAEARGRTILELAISWLLARPVVASVISGATSPRQVEANARAAEWELTEEELDEIDAIGTAAGR
ncbi:MAG TPA: aldo/keto reductase [Gemmatimonadota bacterium]|nr:aldo/keto reductase [Gemmatimonadota bacterium]